MKPRFIWISISIMITICVLLAIAMGYYTWRTSSNQSDKNQASPATSSSNLPDSSTASSEVNWPGAMLGNTQRTWPDPLNIIDDSAHTTPGTYSVDRMWQRPVWTPVNHDGDFPKKNSLKSGFDQCQDPGAVVLQGKTQQQYVNARYLVVNDEAGPTRLERGVPRGYAHSPQGAVVATMNLLGYGLKNQGDEIGEESDKALWQTSKVFQEKRSKQTVEPTKESMRIWRADMVPAPTHIKVVQCSENVMVVSIALEALPNMPTGKYFVSQVPMIWQDGDWQPSLGGDADKRLQIEQNTLDDSFHEVTYS